MIDHVGFPVSDYARSKAFYEKALAPLGYALIMEVPADVNPGGAAACGFGRNGKPDFWIGAEGGLAKPLHVAIVAETRAEVDDFHKAALAAGGTNNGAPRALSPGLLRRLRARPRRAQYRSGLPQAGVRPPKKLMAACLAAYGHRNYSRLRRVRPPSSSCGAS